MRIVAPMPVCKLKCCGSMPTAASPVSTPPLAPLIAAASRPFSHSSKYFIFMGSVEVASTAGARYIVPLHHCYKRLLVECRDVVIDQVVSPVGVGAVFACFPFVQFGPGVRARMFCTCAA